MGEEGVEPSRLLRSTDFKSVVYAISPLARKRVNYNRFSLRKVLYLSGDNIFSAITLIRSLVELISFLLPISPIEEIVDSISGKYFLTTARVDGSIFFKGSGGLPSICCRKLAI